MRNWLRFVWRHPKRNVLVLWTLCALGVLGFAATNVVLAIMGRITDGHFAFLCMMICWAGTQLFFNDLKKHRSRKDPPP